MKELVEILKEELSTKPPIQDKSNMELTESFMAEKNAFNVMS